MLTERQTKRQVKHTSLTEVIMSGRNTHLSVKPVVSHQVNVLNTVTTGHLYVTASMLQLVYL